MKPQVLQFLLDLVEVQTEASADSSGQTSTLFDDECLKDATMNDEPVGSAANGASLGSNLLCTASDQRTEYTASQSVDSDGDSQESDSGDAGRCSVLGTNVVNRYSGLSSNELTTSDEVSPSDLKGITGTDPSDDQKIDFTSPDSSAYELKSSVHNRRSDETSAELSKENLHQRGCCESDESSSFASESFSCRQCSVKFDNTADQEEHECGRAAADDDPNASDDRQTLERQQTSSTFSAKTEPHINDDISAQEDVGGSQECERAFSTMPLAKDVTWNTLIGTESPDENVLCGEAQRPTNFQELESSSDKISAASAPVQPVINDRTNVTVSSSSDCNTEGHIVSAGGLSDYSVSRLFSNAWNALLLHIGLDCVTKFNRYLLHSNSGCDLQLDGRMSKSDENERPRVRDVDDPRTSYDDDAEENLTREDDQSEAERCQSLRCFCCLQGFVDTQSLQTHMEQTHCQQQSLDEGLHSRPDQLHDSVVSGSGLSSVAADSSALASAVSGHVTSVAGPWNRLPDSTSSYFGGISPEILSLLSAVPPELMLPHIYPGSVIPPAMMMMMMASPFVDCPSSPLPNPLAALADPHACLLPSSAAESRATCDDATMASVHQQSKRARTRISDSQLAVLRARFDINGPPNDDEIAAIGFEIGLPSKVVKHWFRNTLFKERQRCKDSPYNFNVPPSCDPPSVSSSSAAIEKAAETAAAEIIRGQSSDDEKDYDRHDIRSDSSLMSTPATDNDRSCPSSLSQPSLSAAQCRAAAEAPYFPHGCYFGVPYHHPAPQAMPLMPSVAPVPPAAVSGAPIVSMTATTTGVAAHHTPTTTQSRGHGKRASRTHFSDEQVRTLQEHFERNAYPRDDELESLSRRLGLSARVIVVWFQNARQKARRTYENHSSAAGSSGSLSGGSKTDDGIGGPRYDCRSCGAAFQRYYELIKHQRSHVGCGSIVPSTSTTKYPVQVSESVAVSAARHDASQLRCNKPPCADAAAAPVTSPSSRHHYNHRRHQPQQSRVEAWYRPPVEGYGGAVSSRGPEVVTALPVQHALPAVFPPHLPLMTSWNSATGCKEETTSCKVSSGIDMTAGRRQTDLAESLVDKKCEAKYVVDHTSPEQSAKSVTTDMSDSDRHSAVRHDDDHKTLQKDCSAQQPSELPLNSAEQTSYSSTDTNRHGLTEVMSTHFHHRIMASPTAPSTGMFSDSSAEQQGRQLMGGGEIVATSLSSPRRCYDVQRRAISLDSPLFGVNTVAGENESPLDLSFQGRTTSTWCGSDRSSEALGETALVDDLKQIGPATSADGGGSLSGSGSTSRSQQAGGSSKRHRTHMSDLQVRVMRAIYADHRTPSIGECATLGAKIGLARRVVQVWFQNARAKDKKRCMTEGGLDEGGGPGDGDCGMTTGDRRCRWCGVTYAVERCSVREHVFSPEHVAAVDNIVRASTDAERRGSASGGRAGKRDHRRRLLHRTVSSNSPAGVLRMSSTTLSSTSPTSSVARKFVYFMSLQFYLHIKIMTV